MIVAVTGGRGFLGRYVVAELASRGHHPVVLTRARTEAPRDEAQERVTDYGPDSLSRALSGVESVVHLAAVRGGSRVIDPYLPNILLTQSVLDCSVEAEVRSLVHASTISVYSGTESMPWHEQLVPSPTTAYGVSKLASEHLCDLVSRRTGLVSTNVRLAHLFGFNEQNDYMVNRFLRRAHAGEELVLHAPGRAEREFLYAADAATGIVQAVERGAGGTYNIGSGEALTNEEVASAINEAFDQPGRQRVLDPAGDEGIGPSLMDSSAARRDLGYVPSYTFTTAAREIRELTRGERDVPAVR